MYFSMSRTFWMRAPIEEVSVAPRSSRKVRARHTCVFPTAVFLTLGGNYLPLEGPVLAQKSPVAKYVV